MGASGMAIDASGKPIKKQTTNNGNKGGKNNKGGQKGGKQNGGRGPNRGGGPQRNGGGPAGRGGPNMGRGGPNMGRGGPNMGRGGPNMGRGPMAMIPPFQAMRGPGPMMHGGGPPAFGFFNNASKGGAKNNDIRNGAPQSGYGGPSAASVGQAPIGSKQGNPDVPPVEVPGFGKNSNIHELFGKMVWRKMEQIRDQSTVDNLQNRIMNLIHETIANQDTNQNGGGFNGNNGAFAPTNQKGPAFNNGFQKF